MSIYPRPPSSQPRPLVSTPRGQLIVPTTWPWNLDNLVCWFNPENLMEDYSDEDSISQWDEPVSGWNATQGTALYQPTFKADVLNGYGNGTYHQT